MGSMTDGKRIERRTIQRQRESESDAETHRTQSTSCKILPNASVGFREALGVRTRPRVALASQSGLRPNTPEFESGLGFYDLTVHLKQRIDQEIDRSAFRLRVDHQIATLR